MVMRRVLSDSPQGMLGPKRKREIERKREKEIQLSLPGCKVDHHLIFESVDAVTDCSVLMMRCFIPIFLLFRHFVDLFFLSFSSSPDSVTTKQVLNSTLLFSTHTYTHICIVSSDFGVWC